MLSYSYYLTLDATLDESAAPAATPVPVITVTPPAIPAPPAAIVPPPKAAKDALVKATPLKELIAVPDAVAPSTPALPNLQQLLVPLLMQHHQ